MRYDPAEIRDVFSDPSKNFLTKAEELNSTMNSFIENELVVASLKGIFKVLN
jgi:hypothetical protein